MQNAVELLNCARPSLKRCHMDGIICWPKTCADVQAVNSIVTDISQYHQFQGVELSADNKVDGLWSLFKSGGRTIDVF